MPDSPVPTTPRRRRLRFSLQSSLIAMTVMAAILATVGNLLNTYFAEQRVAREITNAGGYVERTLLGKLPPDGDPRDCDSGPKWLHRVVFVRLSGSDIDDDHLARLGLQRFKHLRHLCIGYHAVFGIDGPKWESFPAPITDRGLAELPPLPKLQYLYLWDMSIGDAGLAGLAARYPRLEHVNLWDTRVTDLTMVELGQLEHLRFLQLRKTMITDSGLAHLATAKNLEMLDLSETRIVGDGFEHLAGLQKLRMLDLRETDVNDDSLCHLARLPELSHLHLQKTNIGDEGVRQLQDLQELTLLRLDATEITDAGVGYLVQLPHLKRISLEETVVTDAGLAQLAAMPSLKRIYLEGTDVTMAGVDDFLRREPDRTVFFNKQVIKVEDLPCK